MARKFVFGVIFGGVDSVHRDPFACLRHPAGDGGSFGQGCIKGAPAVEFPKEMLNITKQRKYCVLHNDIIHFIN